MNSKILFLVFCFTLFFSCSKDNEKSIYIADTMVNCTSVAAQKCLQIKENEKDNWSNLFTNIEGFDFEEGYSYKLKVEVTKIENPPADASSEKYVLLEILKKTKTPVKKTKIKYKNRLYKVHKGPKGGKYIICNKKGYKDIL